MNKSLCWRPGTISLSCKGKGDRRRGDETVCVGERAEIKAAQPEPNWRRFYCALEKWEQHITEQFAADMLRSQRLNIEYFPRKFERWLTARFRSVALT